MSCDPEPVCTFRAGDYDARDQFTWYRSRRSQVQYHYNADGTACT